MVVVDEWEGPSTAESSHVHGNQIRRDPNDKKYSIKSRKTDLTEQRNSRRTTNRNTTGAHSPQSPSTPVKTSTRVRRRINSEDMHNEDGMSPQGRGTKYTYKEDKYRDRDDDERRKLERKESKLTMERRRTTDRDEKQRKSSKYTEGEYRRTKNSSLRRTRGGEASSDQSGSRERQNSQRREKSIHDSRGRLKSDNTVSERRLRKLDAVKKTRRKVSDSEEPRRRRRELRDFGPDEQNGDSSGSSGRNAAQGIIRQGDYDYKADGVTMALTRHNIAQFTTAPKNELKHIETDIDFKQVRAQERRGIQQRINKTMDLFYSKLDGQAEEQEQVQSQGGTPRVLDRQKSSNSQAHRKSRKSKKNEEGR